MSWHADTAMLRDYVAGALDDVTRWSVEEHVSACASCRSAIEARGVAGLDLDASLDAVWVEVTYELDVSTRRSAVERLLVVCGVRDDLARLLVATPALTVSWLLGVAATLAVAVAAAWAGYTPGAAAPSAPVVFLVLAPLLPLAGVAVSFGPGIDPTYDIGLAAPLQSGRLLLVRTVAVLTSSVPLALIAGLALPELNWAVVAWVFPALALAGATLALSTRVDPLLAGGALAMGWVGGVSLVEAAARAPLAAFGAPTQLAAAVVAAGAAVYVTRHHDRFDDHVVGR